MSKKIEKLSVVPADVVSISGQSISTEVMESRNNKVVISQLFKKVSVESGFNSCVVPQAPVCGLTVQVVSAGQSLNESNYTFNGVTVEPTKKGCFIAVTTEALKQAPEPTINQIVSEISNAISIYQDADASTVLLGLTQGTLSESDFTDGTLASNLSVPMIGIDSINGGTISSVDYYSGKILLTGSMSSGTVVYTYSNLTTYSDASSKGTVTSEDILRLRSSLSANSLNPNIVLINPQDVPNAFDNNTGFVGVKAYATNENVLNGEIGCLMDLNILSSPNVPVGVVAVIDSSRLGYDVESRLNSSVKENRTKDQKEIRTYLENIFILGDTCAVGLLVNGQYNASGSI